MQYNERKRSLSSSIDLLFRSSIISNMLDQGLDQLVKLTTWHRCIIAPALRRQSSYNFFRL